MRAGEGRGKGQGEAAGVRASGPKPSVTKRTGSAYRTTVHPTKQWINAWLCGLAAAADMPRAQGVPGTGTQSEVPTDREVCAAAAAEARDAPQGTDRRPQRAAKVRRALILETSALVTVDALLRGGVCRAGDIFVPQPDARQCAALCARGVRTFAGTSHEFLRGYAAAEPVTAITASASPAATIPATVVTTTVAAAVVAGGQPQVFGDVVHTAAAAAAVESGYTALLPLRDDTTKGGETRGAPEGRGKLVGEDGGRGAFSFVFLDYCGTLTSKVGRQRQADLLRLLRGGLLQDGATLAVTLSARGALELYEGEVVSTRELNGTEQC